MIRNEKTLMKHYKNINDFNTKNRICIICGKMIYATSDLVCQAIKHGYRPSILECDTCRYTRQKTFNTILANQEIEMIMNVKSKIDHNWGTKITKKSLEPINALLQNMSLLNNSNDYISWLNTINVYKYMYVTNDIERARKNYMLEVNIL